MLSRKQFFNRLQVLGVAALTVSQLVGCSGSDDGNRRPTAPTSGVVKYKGQPVEGATVTFTTVQDPISAFGITDASGKFSLFTYEEGDGAVIGEHDVTITKTDGVTPKAEPPSTGNQDPLNLETYNPPPFGYTPPPTVKHLIPEKYSIAGKSGLKATVKEEGPNEVTFDLTD